MTQLLLSIILHLHGHLLTHLLNICFDVFILFEHYSLLILKISEAAYHKRCIR